MSIQTAMANATATAASLFTKLLLAAALVFALLLLSIHFGWSMVASFIFMIAGLATSTVCFFADAIKGLFGKGRAVGLGVISLYLSLMSTLAYAAPDFFSGLGINGWMGLTTIFFAATTGGSVALISFEKASKVVAVLVILFTGFGLISEHVFARGMQYLASNAAGALGRKAYSMGYELEDSEGDIKVKYRAEYQVKKAALEKEWESGKITAKVYEEKRKTLDNEYEPVLKPQPTPVQVAPPAGESKKARVPESECTTPCSLYVGWSRQIRTDGRPVRVKFFGQRHWMLLSGREHDRLSLDEFSPGEAQFTSPDKSPPVRVQIFPVR